MIRRLWPVAALLVLGTGWGATQPLGKIAASSGHGFLALVFWQSVVGVLLLGMILLALRRPVPLTRRGLAFATVIALVGTVIPNSTFYLSVRHLPAGVMSILIAMVPLLAFPIALALGSDRFSLRRLFGLLSGFAGIGLIAAPGAALPDPGMAAWLPVALIGPLFYAVEGNLVARWGTGGLDPLQTLFLVSVIAALICGVAMAPLGQAYWLPLPPDRPAAALILSSSAHALLYSGYVALASRAGAVFAAQTGYVVTAAGVFWAMALLGERFPPGIWLALAVILLGLFLVSPRLRRAAAD